MHKRFKSDRAAFALVCVIASGCGAGLSNQPHGRAAGEWSVTLPTAATYSQGLAYGKGGSPMPDTWVDLESVVQPMLAEARPQRVSGDEPKKKAVRKSRTAEPRPTSTEPAQQQAPVIPPASRYERTEIALADTTQPLQSQQQADTSLLNRYEERQAQSQEQQKFRGGDAIIIGASTLVIVLLIVLLVVLLL